MVIGRATVSLFVLLASAQIAGAQPVADFYRGKTVDLFIGYRTGGGYDVYGRVVARHIGRHIPGQPNVVVKNLDGAGGLRLANHMAQVAPRDGTAIAITGRNAAFEPLFGNKLAQFDGRAFGWLGSANKEVSICASMKGAEVADYAALLEKELIIAGTGAANDTDQIPKVINAVLGTKFKLIPGYPTGNGLTLAMERREVNGRCGWSWSSIKSTHPHWVKSGEINLLVQVGMEKHPDLPHVPLILDVAKTPEQKELLRIVFASLVLGRPFFTTPGVPADRLAALRKAFMDTLSDPQFLTEAEKTQLEVTPVSGEEVERLVADIHKAPAALVEKAGELMR
jgi:tripartite-type tricarboxylate transporter receptor subunit TctC